MKHLSEIILIAEAAKKKVKKKKKDPYTPILIDPELPALPANSYIGEHTAIYELFGEELLTDLVERIISEKEVNPRVSIDAEQKNLAYSMSALAAAAALVATKVLVDPQFAKNNKNLAARFNDSLQRAMNIIASDGSILQRLKYNVNTSAFLNKEEYFPLELIEYICEKFTHE